MGNTNGKNNTEEAELLVQAYARLEGQNNPIAGKLRKVVQQLTNFKLAGARTTLGLKNTDLVDFDQAAILTIANKIIIEPNLTTVFLQKVLLGFLVNVYDGCLRLHPKNPIRARLFAFLSALCFELLACWYESIRLVVKDFSFEQDLTKEKTEPIKSKGVTKDKSKPSTRQVELGERKDVTVKSSLKTQKVLFLVFDLNQYFSQEGEKESAKSFWSNLTIVIQRFYKTYEDPFLSTEKSPTLKPAAHEALISLIPVLYRIANLSGYEANTFYSEFKPVRFLLKRLPFSLMFDVDAEIIGGANVNRVSMRARPWLSKDDIPEQRIELLADGFASLFQSYCQLSAKNSTQTLINLEQFTDVFFENNPTDIPEAQKQALEFLMHFDERANSAAIAKLMLVHYDADETLLRWLSGLPVDPLGINAKTPLKYRLLRIEYAVMFIDKKYAAKLGIDEYEGEDL